jgi:hypothetical protein
MRRQPGLPTVQSGRKPPPRSNRRRRVDAQAALPIRYRLNGIHWLSPPNSGRGRRRSRSAQAASSGNSSNASGTTARAETTRTTGDAFGSKRRSAPSRRVSIPAEASRSFAAVRSPLYSPIWPTSVSGTASSGKTGWPTSRGPGAATATATCRPFTSRRTGRSLFGLPSTDGGTTRIRNFAWTRATASWGLIPISGENMLLGEKSGKIIRPKSQITGEDGGPVNITDLDDDNNQKATEWQERKRHPRQGRQNASTNRDGRSRTR